MRNITVRVAESMERWTRAMRERRYEAAWAIERRVLQARDPATRDDPTIPPHQRWVWNGAAPDGRDVLVRCYHGLGDTIQFARFIPPLAARARKVTIELQPRLAPLLGMPQNVAVVPFDPAAPLPRAEHSVEITELCGALRLAPEDLAAPYLAWPPAHLGEGTIGICHTAGDWDPARSISPALFAPICATHACVTLVPGGTTLPVLNPAGCPFDMAATAALVAGVDLVITVDTMIAHLAGAMGKPVWLLLRSQPDWRWAPDRSDSAWYPTMRLFVQPSAGDWRAVMDAVGDALTASGRQWERAA